SRARSSTTTWMSWRSSPRAIRRPTSSRSGSSLAPSSSTSRSTRKTSKWRGTGTASTWRSSTRSRWNSPAIPTSGTSGRSWTGRSSSSDPRPARGPRGRFRPRGSARAASRRPDLLPQPRPPVLFPARAARDPALWHAGRPCRPRLAPAAHLGPAAAGRPDAAVEPDAGAGRRRLARLDPRLLLRLLPAARHQRPADQDGALALPRRADRVLHRPAACAASPALWHPQPSGSRLDRAAVGLRHGRTAGGLPSPAAADPSAGGGRSRPAAEAVGDRARLGDAGRDPSLGRPGPAPLPRHGPAGWSLRPSAVLFADPARRRLDDARHRQVPLQARDLRPAALSGGFPGARRGAAPAADGDLLPALGHAGRHTLAARSIGAGGSGVVGGPAAKIGRAHV